MTMIMIITMMTMMMMIIIIIVSFIGKVISVHINITVGTASAMWTKVVNIYMYTLYKLLLINLK